MAPRGRPRKIKEVIEETIETELNSPIMELNDDIPPDPKLCDQCSKSLPEGFIPKGENRYCSPACVV